MAESEALLGYGTIVEVETSTGVWFELGEVTSVTPPNLQVDDVEVTHMQSPDATKEYIPGLTEPGDMSLVVNHIPGEETDDYVVAWKAGRAKRNVRITYPNAATETFKAYVKGWAPGDVPVGDKISSTLTVKVTGPVTRG